MGFQHPEDSKYTTITDYIQALSDSKINSYDFLRVKKHYMKQNIIFFILWHTLNSLQNCSYLKIDQPLLASLVVQEKQVQEMLFLQQLVSERRVKVSYKANSETGIPLNILGLTPKSFSIDRVAQTTNHVPNKTSDQTGKDMTHIFVEMGIDSPDAPKNMEYLTYYYQTRYWHHLKCGSNAL